MTAQNMQGRYRERHENVCVYIYIYVFFQAVNSPPTPPPPLVGVGWGGLVVGWLGGWGVVWSWFRLGGLV